MDKTQILIIGTNKPIMETIARLIDQDEKWLATIAASTDEAIKICLKQQFSLALICAGLSTEDELELNKRLKELYPTLPIIMHYGGGSGLLFAEILKSFGPN